MGLPAVTIVVPTIRRANIAEFLAAWRDEFAGHRVIVMEDNPEPTFDLGDSSIVHLSWKDIDSELAEWSWIIPRRTDCVRSFGYFKAVQLGTDVIVTLDDDCFPIAPGFIEKHVRNLFDTSSEDAWVSTGTGVIPRGVPYLSRKRSQKVGISHGLWTNVPDYDACTQLVIGRGEGRFEPVHQSIPVGKYYPMCGMNLAWRAELTPAMYFLLMGREWPFDRFGDIWAGVFSKKICDHLGMGVVSGDPMIEHRRASNVWANLQKEAPGLPFNEQLWSAVDSIVLTETTVAGCYAQLARDLSIEGDYWTRLRDAMSVWAELVENALDAHRSAQDAHRTDMARNILRSERCRLQPAPIPQRLPA